ncbi:hypothetical+protein [Methylocapsa aurea]
MCAPHGFRHALDAQADAQRQRVDEETDRTIGAGAAMHASEQHSAEHDIVAARRARQQLNEGLMAQARRAHAQRARPIAQSPRHARIQRETRVADAGAVALRVAQAEGSGRLAHIAEHGSEEGLVFLAGDAEPRLRDEVTEREWREQSFAFAKKIGPSLLDHDFERRVIRGQMMRQDQQQPSIRRGIVREDPRIMGA